MLAELGPELLSLTQKVLIWCLLTQFGPDLVSLDAVWPLSGVYCRSWALIWRLLTQLGPDLVSLDADCPLYGVY